MLMKNNTGVRTERILCSSVGRMLTFATLLALTLGMAGCQNGKCKSCLFRNNDKDKINETQLGQAPSQDPPAPPAVAPVSTIETGPAVGSDQRIAIAPTPVAPNPAPANSIAANELGSQRIPNTAGDVNDALSSRQPTLDSLPDANTQAWSYANPQNQTTIPEQRYQSVSPVIPDPSLGFAPAEQDHSASLAPEAKGEPLPPAPPASLPSEMIGLPEPTTQSETPDSGATSPATSENSDLPAEAVPHGINSEPKNVVPPTESETPDPVAAPAPEDVTANYAPTMRDAYALEAAYSTREPVVLKGSARAQYIGNTAATASGANRASASATATAPTPTTTRQAARPATTAQPTYVPRPSTVAIPSAVASATPLVVPNESNAVVPNGQTSSIIPGMKLGVVDFSQRARAK